PTSGKPGSPRFSISRADHPDELAARLADVDQRPMQHPRSRGPAFFTNPRTASLAHPLTARPAATSDGARRPSARPPWGLEPAGVLTCCGAVAHMTTVVREVF